jgi:Lrp/AsnC family leucine-responsive transcriptional regulator
LKPDAVDTKILETLMDDGRASFRQIAKRTSLTTPTVSTRLARMMKAGLIKKFVPILSADSVNRGALALVTLEIDPGSAEKVAKDFAKLREVQNVYMTTGQGITLKVALEGAQELQPFLKRKVLGRPNVKVVSSQIITSIVKEEPASMLPTELTMNLECDYCHGAVTSSRPYTVVAWPSHYYFCCKTCRKAYLDKFGQRLGKIRKRGLHS